MSTQAREFIAVPIAVMTVSDSRTEADDKSGKLLVGRVQDAGHQFVEKVMVPDDVFQIRAVVSRWIANPDIQVVLMTGGTGVTGFDGTPEAVKPLFEKELDGFGDIFRAISFEEIGTSSLQSRAVAGVATVHISSHCRGLPVPAQRPGINCWSTSGTIGLAPVTSVN